MSVAAVANLSETPRDDGKVSKASSSPCLLPILEGKQTRADENALDTRETSAPVSRKAQENLFDRDRTFITAGSDFIPEDILTSLTQVPVPPSREQLGPPSKHKKLKPLEVSALKVTGRFANKSLNANFNTSSSPTTFGSFWQRPTVTRRLVVGELTFGRWGY